MLFYNKRIFQRCFSYKGKYWYRNFKYIPLYFELMHDLIKHGYDEYATWETFDWFIVTMSSILKRYKENHHGTPIVIDNYPMNSLDDSEESKKLTALNEQEWDNIINRMIELLDLMDENNSKYDTDEYDSYEGYKRMNDEMHTAKDEFFELFSKYFYHLWD